MHTCECVRCKVRWEAWFYLLSLLAITITPPCQGPVRADGRTECFMEPMITAEPELEVADWNYLVLRFRVIKSGERAPGIIAGWAARLREHLRLLEEYSKGSPEILRVEIQLLLLPQMCCCSDWNVWFYYAGMKWWQTMLGFKEVSSIVSWHYQGRFTAGFVKKKTSETWLLCSVLKGFYVSVLFYSVPRKYKQLLIFLFWLQFSIAVTC